MRPFTSPAAFLGLIAAATAIALALLGSPIGDPVAPHTATSAPATNPPPDSTRNGTEPSIHPLRRYPARTQAAPAEPTTADAGIADEAAASAPLGWRAGVEPASPGTVPPAAARSADRADEDSVSRIMYCHLAAGGPSAAEMLQECLDRAPAFSSVEVPPGTYVLHRQVVLTRPVTLRTAGSAETAPSCAATPPLCATFQASPDFLDPYGVLLLWNAASVTLQDLIIDGNRAARLGSTAAQWCARGRTASGFNAGALNCTGCGLDAVVSKNALCGTAMVWSGINASIRRSEFRDNGDAATPRMWADGLTVLYAPDSDIRANRFIDNSDIGLIVGHAARSRIEGNTIIQRTQRIFAGLMLDNFNSNDLERRGDFRGGVIANNTVDCAGQLCVFGIQVGPRPWYPTRNIVGGELSGNEVRGAQVGINIDGAGVRLAPFSLYGNVVSATPAAGRFTDCARPIPTAALNVSPTSIVRMARDASPDAAHLSDACQLWSAVGPPAAPLAP